MTFQEAQLEVLKRALFMSKNQNQNQNKPQQQSAAPQADPTKDAAQQLDAAAQAAADQAAADSANAGAGDVVIKELGVQGGNTTATIPAAPGTPDAPVIDAAAIAAAAAEGAVKVQPMKEATFETTPDVVKAAKQVNHKGSAATALIIERVERHMDFLNSRVRLATEKARNTEQVTFIETVGEALKQDYDRFEIVADLLMDSVRENAKLFNSGLAFRFMEPLQKEGYSPEALQGYKAFFNFLITVAKNWKRRHQLQQFVDITYVIEGYPAKARENITQFYNKLASA